MSTCIEVNNLSFGYNKNLTLSGVSFHAKQGELICLLGTNGAGKTTLINLLLNRLPLQSGDITILGTSNIHTIKDQMGVMLQNSTAPERATVKELIQLFSSYYPAPYAYHDLVQLLHLEHIEKQRFNRLSGGQKQLTLFALALCGNPNILFLDEPTVGMDIQTRRTLFQVIETLKNQGKTILLTTHYLNEADALSDRIMVLKDGKIIANDTPGKIKARFENKRIHAFSEQTIDWITNIPYVLNVEKVGKHFHVMTNNAEQTLKYWLNHDASISDLSINHTDLEQAFINITNQTDA